MRVINIENSRVVKNTIEMEPAVYELPVECIGCTLEGLQLQKKDIADDGTYVRTMWAQKFDDFEYYIRMTRNQEIRNTDLYVRVVRDIQPYIQNTQYLRLKKRADKVEGTLKGGIWTQKYDHNGQYVRMIRGKRNEERYLYEI